MHLREAKPIDVHDMGSIQADCNVIDTLSRYFVQHQEEYPTSYYQGSIRFVKRRTAISGSIAVVVETDPSDYPPDTRYKSPEVIGFAIWNRQGTSPIAQEWKSRYGGGFFAAFNRMLDGLEDRYLGVFTGVNPTFRPDKMAEIIPYLATPFDEHIFAEAWELDLCFVHPNWQRKGVGKTLMQWGFDHATEEKVPVLVKSSPLGAKAYRAVGFQSLGEIDLRRFYDTTEFGGEEPQMWCWEPAGQKGFWYERGKEALEKLLREREEKERNEKKSGF